MSRSDQLELEDCDSNLSEEEFKCDQCNYKTKVKRYLKGHMLAHSGQYMCQQGCKEYLKTWSELDRHHELKHGEREKVETFKCDSCESMFKEAHQLRIHKEKKHSILSQFDCGTCQSSFQNVHHLRIHEEKNHIKLNQPTHITCDVCGQIFYRKNEFENHRNICANEFHEVSRNKECYFYNKGNCLKGDSCKFKHKQRQQRIPECKNGSDCRYLRRGVCSFFHRGMGVQKPKQNYPENTNSAKSGTWCKFTANCAKVPNCPYLHSNQDFPKLPKVAKPPFWQQSTIQAWQDY